LRFASPELIRKTWKNSGSDCAVEPGTNGAVFPANIVIVAEDDKTWRPRALEMFGYKFLLACSPGID
jgi:hypothetical protein